MPNPLEICEIRVAGINYKWWKEVEVGRTLRQGGSSWANVVVAEIGDLKKGWASLRLPPGAHAEVTLAGELAITGQVIVRQVAYDATNHNVRFVVHSRTIDAVKSSADVPPGQFKNQDLKKMANAALKPFGVSFDFLRGVPPGADKIFERVSIHMGESAFQFVLRLAQMRNVHIIDTAQGNLVGFRGVGPVIAELQEGRNILSAELVWSIVEANDPVHVRADQWRNDKHHGDTAARQSAKATNPNAKSHSPLILVAPEPADIKAAQMYANHVAQLAEIKDFHCAITVRGWQRDNGSLWLNALTSQVEVYSPMLFPSDRMTLGVEGVICRQSDQGGTTTTIELVPTWALGQDNVSVDPNSKGASPAPPTDAIPYAPDDL